jgi:uncharacterized protein (TIGR03437 family)
LAAPHIREKGFIFAGHARHCVIELGGSQHPRNYIGGIPMAKFLWSKRLLFAILWIAGQSVPAAAQGFQWIRQFGSSMGDLGSDAVVSPSGVYVVGSVGGVLPGQTSAGGNDAFVRKYDFAGNELWTRQFGTNFNELATGVAADANAVYVTGFTDGAFAGQNSAGNSDAFLRKYDAAGNHVWTRQFGTVSVDQGFGVAVDASGVYMAGSVNGALTGQTGLGGTDVFVRKYDPNGTEAWTRQFGTSTTDLARGVAAAGESVYVVGEVGNAALPGQSSAGGSDAFVRKYDSNGAAQWTRQFGSASNDAAHGVAVNGANVYVAGAVGGVLPGQSNFGFADAFFKMFDLDGAEQWTRQFGTTGVDGAATAAADPTGAYVAGFVGGALPGRTQVGGTDAFVRKYDVNGNDRWTAQFGTTTTDTVAGADANEIGLHVAGYTQGTLPGGGAGGQDPFVSQISAGGPPFLPFNGVVGGANYVPSVTAGSIASAFGFSLAPASGGSLLVQANGIAAPVYAATNSQINFQVPWELAGSQQNFLVVTVDGSTAGQVTIPVAAHAPGIFSTNASGSGQGAILIANTAFVAAPAGMFPGSRPVIRGADSLSIFCTGLGTVTNQPPTGVAASGNSTTITQPTVTIGGVPATVSFSGLAPGFFGLYQVNVQVPPNAPTGGEVPLTLTIGGVTSNTVTIAVQ